LEFHDFCGQYTFFSWLRLVPVFGKKWHSESQAGTAWHTLENYCQNNKARLRWKSTTRDRLLDMSRPNFNERRAANRGHHLAANG
jgi:predicted NAD-dependent protein-ADP-ribosyltransferase YbiA (DUF1768 family)